VISKPKRGRPAGAGKKNLGGRPPLADADRRETLVRVLTNEVEYAELQRAAAYVGMGVSTWLRIIGLERARAIAAEKEAARDRREQ
jgi:hypothetical protein